MAKILQVTLKTTLKGKTIMPMGSVFTGPIEELPADVARAVELGKRYIDVVEVPSVETPGTVPAKDDSEGQETEGADPQAESAADATINEGEGGSTPEVKSAAQGKRTPSKTRTRKTAPKKSARKLSNK